KFFVYNTEEIKIKNTNFKKFIDENESILEPILILNAPSLKEKQIKNFSLLKTYLYAFEKDLKKSNVLIIWGQSLENDPHIKEIIERKFINNNEIIDKKLIIIDINENHYFLSNTDRRISIEFINPQEKGFIEILREILN
ncbi:MAG: hypothetical protein DSY60_02530, partial [Persephonella sp.]